MERKPKPRTEAEQRSDNMRHIRSRNTKPEIIIRKALWSEGIRYRKNYTFLPGNPDIAITKYKIAIFVDGEFWHGKNWDVKNLRIQKNRDYWIPKIERNINRDIETNLRLKAMGWTILRFWGNDIRKNVSDCIVDIKDAIFQIKMDTYDC